MNSCKGCNKYNLSTVRLLTNCLFYIAVDNYLIDSQKGLCMYIQD